MSHSKSSPNVIWIFGDQHPAHLLSRAGNPNVQTPNIDHLAEYGIHFVNAMATCPLCCPARGTLLTGRQPHHCIPTHDYGLPPESETVADLFNRGGYDTAYFGKWHVRGHQYLDTEGKRVKREVSQHPDAPCEPHKRETYALIDPDLRGGFRTWIGYENNNSPHNTWVHGHRNTEEVPLQRLQGFETDALTDLFIEDLRARTSGPEVQPFFSVLSVQPPHNPYSAPAEFMGRHNPACLQMRSNVPEVDWVQKRARLDLAGACAMVENLDWNIGRIIEALRETGLDTNTYILFFSDHGDMHGSQGLFHKTNPFQESVNIPLIISGGLDVQGYPHDREVTTPIGLVDLAPTSLGLCGIEIPLWMEGQDFSAFKTTFDAAKKTDWPAETLISLPIPTGHGDSTDKAWVGVVTDDQWKYVCLEGREWLMFDLKTDPYEQVNLAHNSIFADKRAELNCRLRDKLKSTGFAFPLPAY